MNGREKAKEGRTHLDAEVASVDIVSEEEVSSIGGFATDLEEFHEIILRYGKLASKEVERGLDTHILAVDVTTYLRYRSEI